MSSRKEKNTEGGSRATGIVRNIIFWVVMGIAVFMMIFTIISATTLNRTDASLFGKKAFVVLSDSMSATDFSAGDVVIVEECDPSTLQVGDIIAYTSESDDNYGEVVTHKIRALATDDYGNPGFITYGTTTNTDDEYMVTYDQVVGKYVTSIPGIGNFITFLKTIPGYICCIFAPFLVLIILQAVRVFKLFKQYKQEEIGKIEEEKRQVESDKADAAKMLKEITELKEQLMRANGQVPASDPAEPVSPETETADEKESSVVYPVDEKPAAEEEKSGEVLSGEEKQEEQPQTRTMRRRKSLGHDNSEK